MAANHDVQQAAQQLAQLIAPLKRDIETLKRGQRTNQLPYSTINNGSLVITDANGIPRQTIGVQPDGTITTVDQNGEPPDIPSVPILSPAHHGLTVTWDGMTDVLGSPPSDFSHVEVHISETDGFTADATSLWGTLAKPGAFIATPLDLVEQYVVLVAVNTSGVPGPQSAQATAVPTDTGMSVVISDTPPVNPLDGDLWFDQANGYVLNQYENGQWSQYQYGTGALAENSVTTAQLTAGSVTAANVDVGILDGTVITAPTINGGQINAADLNISKGPGNAVLIWSGAPPTKQTFYGVNGTTVSWLCPPGVTSLSLVEAMGGGGGGASGINGASGTAGGGGGGGEYAAETNVAVTPGVTYTFTIGAGGVGSPTAVAPNGTAGGATTVTFDAVTITANGGGGGGGSVNDTAGAAGAGSTNTVHFSGGAGGSTLNTGQPFMGGGGGGGSSGAGGRGGGGGLGTVNGGGAAGAAGAAAPDGSSPGSRGGVGGYGGGNGGNGLNPGGGGAGGGAENGAIHGAGGNGAAGMVSITYASSNPVVIARLSADDSGLMGKGTAVDPTSGSNPVPETWKFATYGSNWSTVNQRPLRYMLLPDGTVNIDGNVMNAAAITASSGASQIITTVPAAYCPTRPIMIPAMNYTGSGSVCYVELEPNGQLTVYATLSASQQIRINGQYSTL